MQSTVTSIASRSFGDCKISRIGNGSCASKYGFIMSILWKNGLRSTTRSRMIGRWGSGPIVMLRPSVLI